MTQEPIRAFEKDTTVQPEEEDLFEALTTGKTVTSQKLRLTNIVTGETVWLNQLEGGIVAIANDLRAWFVEGGALTMKPQEPNEESFSTATGTTSAMTPQIEVAPRYFDLRPPPSPGVARILARAPEELRRALAWEREHGDLFENLDELLGDIFRDIQLTWEEWHAVIDEPYEPY